MFGSVVIVVVVVVVVVVVICLYFCYFAVFLYDVISFVCGYNNCKTNIVVNGIINIAIMILLF